MRRRSERRDCRALRSARNTRGESMMRHWRAAPVARAAQRMRTRCAAQTERDEATTRAARARPGAACRPPTSRQPITMRHSMALRACWQTHKLTNIPNLPRCTRLASQRRYRIASSKDQRPMIRIGLCWHVRDIEQQKLQQDKSGGTV